MEPNVKLTPEQIAQYQRDGAVLIKVFLGVEELDLLERGMEEGWENPTEHSMTVRSSEGNGVTLMDHFTSRNCPSLRKLLDIGRIPELAGRAMECPSAHLVLEQTFYKQKGDVNPTPWHQDTPFLRVRGDDMVRVWVSCDYSPSDLTVQVVRGSHRWNVVYNAMPAGRSNRTVEEAEGVTYSGIGDDSLPFIPDIDQFRGSFDILSWDVEPGDAILFHGNILHGAEGRKNHDSGRRAFATIWGGPELRCHTPQGNATPTLADIKGISVPHGDRVADHEEVFPTGWREG